MDISLFIYMFLFTLIYFTIVLILSIKMRLKFRYSYLPLFLIQILAILVLIYSLFVDSTGWMTLAYIIINVYILLIIAMYSTLLLGYRLTMKYIIKK